MNKYLLIGLVAILIIGAGGWYFNQSKPSTDAVQTIQQNTNASASTQKIVAYHYIAVRDSALPNSSLIGYQTKEETIPATLQVADASLKLLFKTYLPALTSHYLGVSITSGVATVSFKAGAHAYLDQAVAGVSAEYVNSIQKTLMQFPTVTKVQFEIDGTLVTNWDA